MHGGQICSAWVGIQVGIAWLRVAWLMRVSRRWTLSTLVLMCSAKALQSGTYAIQTDVADRQGGILTMHADVMARLSTDSLT